MSFFLSFLAIRFANFRCHFLAILADLHLPTDGSEDGDGILGMVGGMLSNNRATGLVIRLCTVFG